MYCAKCGAQNEDGVKFCTSCGANMETDEATEVEVSEQPAESVAEVAVEAGAEVEVVEKKGSGLVKKLIIAAVVLIVVAAAGIFGYKFVSEFFSPKDVSKETHPIVYVKDEQLMLRNQNKKESWLMAEFDEDEYSGYFYNLVQFSDDGEIVFFANDVEDEEFDLYYRKTSQKKPKGKEADEKGIKIASGVSGFQAAADGSFVVYVKEDKLYIYDMKESRSVSNDVTNYYVTEDCKKLIYEKDGEDLYITGLGKNDSPEKIDVEVTSVVSDFDDYDHIYYRKDDDLYYKEKGKDKVKVTTDVYSTIDIGETIFVVKENKKEIKLGDLFEDDCAASDALIERPYYSDYGDYDAYSDAYDKYYEKEEREYIREYLFDDEQEITTYDIYMIEGSKIKEIEKDLVDYYYSGLILKQAGENEKIKLSTITDSSDIYSLSYDMKNNIDVSASMLKSDGKIVPIADYDSEKFYSMAVTEDEKFAYILEDYDYEDSLGTLNKYKITDSGLTSKEKVHDDVKYYYLQEDGTIIVKFDEESLGIYKNGKFTELSDSSQGGFTYEDGVLFYYDQYSSKNSSGTLMKYHNGKKEKIDIDVYDYEIRGTKNIYYIKDYSTKNSRGELYQFKGGKSKLVDSDVNFIVY